MANKSQNSITLRASGGAASRAASAEVGAHDLTFYAPDTSREEVSIPISTVAFVVDLRERRARRMPAALVSDNELRVAGVGVAMPIERATVAIVLEAPVVLPPTLPDRWWADDPHPPDARWDVIAVDGGRETDHLLSVLARRGATRSPSLAAAIVARDAAAAAGQSRGDRTKTRDTVVVSTLGMFVLAILIIAMAATTQSLGWLVVLVLALPLYLISLAKGTRTARRPRA